MYFSLYLFIYFLRLDPRNWRCINHVIIIIIIIIPQFVVTSSVSFTSYLWNSIEVVMWMIHYVFSLQNRSSAAKVYTSVMLADKA